MPRRRVVFLGCEGESERSYGTLIGRLRNEHRNDLHIHAELLRPGGGDPLSLVELACRRIANNERKRDRQFLVRVILLDADRLGSDPDRDRQIDPLAERHRLRLIWQEPCHEAMLLRHLSGCESLRPSTTPSAMAELRRRWPEYQKGIPASQLAARIGLQEILRAASVEEQLKKFLDEIGFPPK